MDDLIADKSKSVKDVITEYYPDYFDGTLKDIGEYYNSWNNSFKVRPEELEQAIRPQEELLEGLQRTIAEIDKELNNKKLSADDMKYYTKVRKELGEIYSIENENLSRMNRDYKDSKKYHNERDEYRIRRNKKALIFPDE